MFTMVTVSSSLKPTTKTPVNGKSRSVTACVGAWCRLGWAGLPVGGQVLFYEAPISGNARCRRISRETGVREW